MELDLTEPWWKIAAILQQEAAHQRLRRLRQRKHCQHIRNGLDWHVYNQTLRQATPFQQHIVARVYFIAETQNLGARGHSTPGHPDRRRLPNMLCNKVHGLLILVLQNMASPALTKPNHCFCIDAGVPNHDTPPAG